MIKHYLSITGNVVSENGVSGNGRSKTVAQSYENFPVGFYYISELVLYAILFLRNLPNR